MAVTRIKNNQITDATITGSKFVANTITGGLLEDDMTYGSNLTVSGNLTVNGTTTTVDTTNTLIADPLLVLSRGESGTPSADSGILVERGTSTNVAFIWDESADVFAAVNTTEDGSTAGDITISSYANIKAADLEGTSLSIDNIDVDGNSITSTDTNGDINLTPDGTGEVVASTIAVSDLTSGRVVLAGTSGAIEDSGNLTFNGSTLAVTGAATVSTTLGVTGNTTVGGTLGVTGVTTLSDALNVTGLASLDGGIDMDGVFTVANTTGNVATTGTLSAGNTDVATLDASGLASLDGGIDVDGAFTVANTSGNISTSGTLGVTGESTLASATISDLTSGRIVTAGTSGALEDSASLLWDGTDLTAGSAIISDLTSGRVVLAGTSGALEDSGNLTFNGSTLAVTGAATISTTLGVTGESTLASATISDLTSGRVVLAGTSGAVEDSANLTFDGTVLTSTKITVDNISIDGDTISSAHDTITIDPSTAGAGGTVVIAGNLQVTGTTTTVDSTVVTIADPVFQIGADSNDSLDRGVKALYNDGASKAAFFGLDDSATEFVFIADATDSSSTFSGSLGSAAFGSLRVTDLTDNRVLIGGTSGEIEDSGNLTFDGSTLAVTGAATISTTLGVTGNTTVGGTLGVTGEATLASATVSDLTSGRVVLAGTSGAIEDSGNLTFDGSTLAVTGAATVSTTLGVTGATTLSSTLDVTGAANFNATTTSTSNTSGAVIIDGGLGLAENLNMGGNLDVDGTAAVGSNATVGGTLGVTGATTLSSTLDVTGVTNFNDTTTSTTNTTGAVIIDGGLGLAENLNMGGNADVDGTLAVGGEATLASATVSDLTATRVVLAGTSGALEDSANLTFSSGTLTVSGSAVVDNVTVDGNSITSADNLTFDAAAAGSIVVNEAGADVDIRMEASGQANALFIEGSTGNVGIRTATPTGDVALHVNTTNSMIPPNGTTAQRPGTPAEGMMRYNSSTKAIEFYNGTEWKTAGSDFTIITADDFSGDGSTVAFTLSEDATSAGLIVALNGVLQDPGTAYSVSGTTLTFTEAPASGDNIDARIITTTTSVTEITDQDTSLAVNDSAGTATATINGSAIMQVTASAVNPGANVTYDLGSTSLRWNTIYGQATSAQYADLAENYTADQEIEPGTVVCFGGEAEVTVCENDADRRVAGVVSTNPAHLMNSECQGDHVVALALQGRVPCKVVGAVAKGDMMVSAGNGAARAEADPKLGSVIGKALENFDGGEGVIEVLVGRQ